MKTEIFNGFSVTLVGAKVTEGGLKGLLVYKLNSQDRIHVDLSSIPYRLVGAENFWLEASEVLSTKGIVLTDDIKQYLYIKLLSFLLTEYYNLKRI